MECFANIVWNKSVVCGIFTNIYIKLPSHWIGVKSECDEIDSKYGIQISIIHSFYSSVEQIPMQAIHNW